MESMFAETSHVYCGSELLWATFYRGVGNSDLLSCTTTTTTAITTITATITTTTTSATITTTTETGCSISRCSRQSESTLLHFMIFH